MHFFVKNWFFWVFLKFKVKKIYIPKISDEWNLPQIEPLTIYFEVIIVTLVYSDVQKRKMSVFLGQLSENDLFYIYKGVMYVCLSPKITGACDVRLGSLRCCWNHLGKKIQELEYHALSHTPSHTFMHFSHNLAYFGQISTC